MIDQIKFVWLSKNIPGTKVEMDADGITTVALRPKIDIIHNSVKRNKTMIHFKDDGAKFLIPNQKVLEEIYRMHMANEEAMLLLHQYCDANLSRE